MVLNHLVGGQRDEDTVPSMNNSSIGCILTDPMIVNRRDLFVMPDFIMGNITGEWQPRSGHASLPRGLQRVDPVELRVVTAGEKNSNLTSSNNTSNSGYTVIEEVERFRFHVDIEQVRAAAAKRSPLRVKQVDGSQREVQQAESDLLYLDPSIVEALRLDDVLDGNEPILDCYSVEMNFEEFRRKVFHPEQSGTTASPTTTTTTTGDQLVQSDAGDPHRTLSIGSSDGMQSYDSEMMRSAEATVSPRRSAASSDGRAVVFAEDAWKKKKKKEEASMSAILRGEQLARRTVWGSLLLTPRSEVAGDLMGCLLVLTTAICLLSLCNAAIDGASHCVQHLAGTLLRSLKALPVMGFRETVRRLNMMHHHHSSSSRRKSSIPLLSILMCLHTVLQSVYFAHYYRSQYSWLGYVE